jgi:predicted MFS family arabinose efflux permease
MAGLKREARLRADVPAIHVLVATRKKDVDARDKPGHDDLQRETQLLHSSKSIAVDETSARYEGWRIVVVCFLVATFGWGLGFYGQSVYVAELHRLRGWPASLISSGTTFFYLFGALLVAFVSEAIRAFGPRNCLVAGVFAMAAAAVSIGQVTEPWQLYLANAVLAFGWAGTSLGIITNTLGLWFDTKRGMAISLALNGASFGGIIGVPLLVAAIGSFGFSGAMIMAAIAMVVLMVPIILFFVGRPPIGSSAVAAAAADAPSATQIRAQAFRDTGFLTVSIAFALVLFAQVGFIVHLIAFLDPVIGREHAAIAVALLTAMAMAGRVLFSTAIDRLNQRLASAISFVSQAVALAIIINSRNDMVLIAACALFGFSVGNLITLPSLIVQREFDPRSFGVLISLITAINQVTYAFGPGVIGLLRDASGSYTLPFYGCIALELIAAVLIMVRGPHGSRRAKARSSP